MNPTLPECQAVQQLWVEEALGRILAAEEIAMRDRHVARCAECRKEAEVLGRLRDADAPGPAPRLDDLARRRWIDQTFERAERALAEEVVGRTAPRFPALRVAAIAAAAVLALGAGLWIAGAGAPEPGAKPSPAAISVATHAAGRLLLTSGEVSLTAASDLGAGEVGQGGRITTGAGTAIAALEGGVVVRLGERTTAEIVRVEPARLEVRLVDGALFASVDPSLKGRTFRVLVGSSAVRVTGTIFSVSRDAAGASVSVFRGGVVVEGEAGEQPVRLGERLAIGAGSAGPIGEDEKARAETTMDVMSALAADGAATVEVESLPADAIVSVDGTEIGVTPLTAALRPGYRRLELRLEGRESVREFLRLAEGGKTARVFDLAPVPPEAGTPVAAAPAQGAAATTTAAGERAPLVPTPDEMLATARDLRAARDIDGAISAYERLVAAYPGTPIARAALVSIGQLYLDRGGDPARAAEAFRRYLAASGGGPLAQEAAFGLALAYRAMGDAGAERTALEAFLRDFGDSPRAKKAADRLAELR